MIAARRNGNDYGGEFNYSLHTSSGVDQRFVLSKVQTCNLYRYFHIVHIVAPLHAYSGIAGVLEFDFVFPLGLSTSPRANLRYDPSKCQRKVSLSD